MKKRHRLTTIVWTIAIAAVAIGAVIQLAFNWRTVLDTKPPEFSPKNMLQALWHQYKFDYLEPGTLRSLDKQRDNVTTSEGQSYSMMRAVWMDDKTTFDQAWQWTKDNIQRRGDFLIAWIFGEREDGTYGILTDRGGYNTASDADVDISVALLFASKRWNEPTYYGDAIVLIRSIWEREVVEVLGRPYLAANNVEKTLPKQVIILNPSYFAPYAYKIFKEVDPSHDWLGVAATSYEVAKASMVSPLDKESSAHLPPDWVGIDRTTGELVAVPQPTSLTTNYSYDALRTAWRFALDWQWNGDPRAKDVLKEMSFLAEEWRKKGYIGSSYSHDGTELLRTESPAMYGGSLGYFMVEEPRLAADVYSRTLERLYDPNMSKWREPLSYYDDNWAWFGVALYHGELRNIYAEE
ncbi:MAG: glycosyl hydrolase family 8 [bacterium]|nr:glycosyl hydrolase family 8 [bacterium]